MEEAASNDSSTCFYKRDLEVICCQDYRNISGKCEACIGSWGKNCKNNCSYGFFGHGCRYKCSCTKQQKCDPVQGCQDLRNLSNLDSTTDKNGSDLEIVILSAVATVLLVVILSGIVYCRRKYAKTNRKEKIISRPGRTIEREIKDQNINIYTDIRESKIVNSGDDTSFHYTLPRQFYKTEFENRSCKNKLQKTLPALKRFRFFQQTSPQNTSSEETYDFCSQEKETKPYSQLIFKEAIQNTRENDIEHAYIDVIAIDDDKAITIEVAQPRGS